MHQGLGTNPKFTKVLSAYFLVPSVFTCLPYGPMLFIFSGLEDLALFRNQIR